MTWFSLLVDAVAVYRLTRLISADTILEPVRSRIMFRRDGTPREWWSELLGCRWCVGVYVGVGVALARWVIPDVWSWVAYAWALAAAAPLLARLEDD